MNFHHMILRHICNKHALKFKFELVFKYPIFYMQSSFFTRYNDSILDIIINHDAQVVRIKSITKIVFMSITLMFLYDNIYFQYIYIFTLLHYYFYVNCMSMYHWKYECFNVEVEAQHV